MFKRSLLASLVVAGMIAAAAPAVAQKEPVTDSLGVVKIAKGQPMVIGGM